MTNIFRPKIQYIWRRTLDLLFPHKCAACGTAGTAFCDACISKSSPAPATTPHIIALFSYRDTRIRKALWSFKYKRNRALAAVLAKLLYDYFLEEYAESKIFSDAKVVLIPIPITKQRKKERGFNQSELLVQEMSFIDAPMSFNHVLDVLYRMREAPPQATIKNRAERIKNIKNIFAVRNAHKIIGRSIIVIDDITTTGATLEEARKVLLAAGAKEVRAIAIAH